MQKCLKILIFFALFFQIGLITQSYAQASRRPEYAQYGAQAFFNSLGIAGAMIPGGLHNIHTLPSNLNIDDFNNSYYLTYGYEGKGSNRVAFDYATKEFYDDPNLTIGIGGSFTFLQEGASYSSNYYKGTLSALFPFEGYFVSGASYNFDGSGRLGVNFKLPFNQFFDDKSFDMGFLLGASYSIDWLGFTFTIGISNLGFISNNSNIKGIYPDLNLGVAYNHYDGHTGERVVSLAFALENNLGEYIKDSTVIGIAISTRVFTTGIEYNKVLINDSSLDVQDDTSKIFLKDDFFTSLYFNVGFQFSDNAHFALGLSSIIESYTIDLALILPSPQNSSFSFYVSVANPF